MSLRRCVDIFASYITVIFSSLLLLLYLARISSRSNYFWMLNLPFGAYENNFYAKRVYACPTVQCPRRAEWKSPRHRVIYRWLCEFRRGKNKIEMKLLIMSNSHANGQQIIAFRPSDLDNAHSMGNFGFFLQFLMRSCVVLAGLWLTLFFFVHHPLIKIHRNFPIRIWWSFGDRSGR